MPSQVPQTTTTMANSGATVSSTTSTLTTDATVSQSVQEKDLEVLSKWVKEELYLRVKLLPNPDKNLHQSGDIFELFEHSLKDKLSCRALPEKEQELYRLSLWLTATSKRSKDNLVLHGLSNRRSGTYVNMHSKFNDIVDFCAAQKEETNQGTALFPSWEAFRCHTDIPGMYYIVYNFFIRALLGEERWKQAMRASSGYICTPQEEAFVFLMLKNNYFAWLLEGKDVYEDVLPTDYDDDTHDDDDDLPSFAEGWLNMVPVLTEEGSMVTNNATSSSASWILDIHREVNTEAYENALKGMKDKTEDIRNTKARQSCEYQRMINALKTFKEDTSLLLPGNKERQKKRRSICKSFRPYTGPAHMATAESRQRGWSDESFLFMQEIIKEIVEDNTSGKRKALHQMVRSINKAIQDELKERRSSRKRKIVEVDTDILFGTKAWKTKKNSQPADTSSTSIAGQMANAVPTEIDNIGGSVQQQAVV